MLSCRCRRRWPRSRIRPRCSSPLSVPISLHRIGYAFWFASFQMMCESQRNKARWENKITDKDKVHSTHDRACFLISHRTILPTAVSGVSRLGVGRVVARQELLNCRHSSRVDAGVAQSQPRREPRSVTCILPLRCWFMSLKRFCVDLNES